MHVSINFVILISRKVSILLYVSDKKCQMHRIIRFRSRILKYLYNIVLFIKLRYLISIMNFILYVRALAATLALFTYFLCCIKYHRIILLLLTFRDWNFEKYTITVSSNFQYQKIEKRDTYITSFIKTTTNCE